WSAFPIERGGSCLCPSLTRVRKTLSRSCRPLFRPLPPSRMCVADDKKYWRKVLGECRRGLPIPYVTAGSRRVQAQVIESYCYRTAPTIVLYAAKDNEVAADLLLEDALGAQRLVLLPKIVPETRELLIVRLRNKAELIPGTFNILEPGGTEVVPAADLGPALF